MYIYISCIFSILARNREWYLKQPQSTEQLLVEVAHLGPLHHLNVKKRERESGRERLCAHVCVCVCVCVCDVCACVRVMNLLTEYVCVCLC